jgi:hypothetical protein
MWFCPAKQLIILCNTNMWFCPAKQLGILCNTNMWFCPAKQLSILYVLVGNGIYNIRNAMPVLSLIMVLAGQNHIFVLHSLPIKG